MTSPTVASTLAQASRPDGDDLAGATADSNDMSLVASARNQARAISTARTASRSSRPYVAPASLATARTANAPMVALAPEECEMGVRPFGARDRATENSPGASVRNSAASRVAPVIKRGIDVIVAGSALLLLSPLAFLVGILCAVKLGRPVLFRQARPGVGGRAIMIVKFRSMRNATDSAGRPLPDDQRLTSFGKLLRRTSLDEIPQLWSVLKGDLSLVGPRPLLMEYLPLYTPFQMRRHDVRPGITGWAQVNGRNAIDWDRKFELDIWYVDNWSIWLDIKILCLTVARVVRGQGVASRGSATMPAFTGSKARRTVRVGDFEEDVAAR